MYIFEPDMDFTPFLGSETGLVNLFWQSIAGYICNGEF
jgi:hypothetical protein